MKDSKTNLAISQKTKVASSLNNSISSLTPIGRNLTTSKFGNNTENNQQNNLNNSDDEFELPIGNLIIDLDADIEKSNERLSSENESQFSSNNNSVIKSPSNSILGLFEKNSKTMSTSKLTRDVNNGPSNSNHQTNTISNNTNSNLSSSNNKTNLIQSSNVDKGLKMKIKRKSIGGKSSESKLEIVQSDTIPRNNANFNLKSDKNGLNNSSNNSTNNSSTANNSTKELNENCNNEKIKHSSNKNKNNSHKEKKEKKDKNSNGSLPINNKNDSNNSSSSNSILSSNTDSKDQRNHLAVPNFDKKVSNQSQTINETSLSNNTSINSNTLNNNTQVKKDNNENTLDNPPYKKFKNEDTRVTQNSSINQSNNKSKPEMRSVSTLTSVGTITEPECLGFCEPGSTVCLEGIVWQETEGILVINVTWRGKTYVGTLLDCTRHDWAPPRLCDSPTSDLETKGLKNGRGKRTRSSISEVDSRLFQSKLRNGKGRRNNFTVPASPIKTDQNQGKKNGKSVNFKELDNKNLQARKTPTPNSIDFNSNSGSNTPTSKKQNQLVLIECPEPNCSKKYKNMNGLKYHQEHVHSGTSYSKDDIDESFKDSMATTDTEDMDTESIANSPKQLSEVCNENTSDFSSNQLKAFDTNTTTDDNVDKKSLDSCGNQDSLKNNLKTLNTSVKQEVENVLSPTAYSDISDVNENSNEANEDLNFDKSTTSNSLDSKNLETNLEDLNKQEQKISNEKLKEQDLQKNENEVKEETKLNNFNFTSNEKNDLLNKNLQEKNLQDQLNANCHIPFNIMNNPHYPLSIDSSLHAFLMHQNNFERHLAEQDRLLIDDSHKQLNKESQQNPSMSLGLNSFNKNDGLHPNEFKNSLDFKQQMSHKQMSISPNNRFSPQTLNQQQVQNSHAALFNQQNKSSSPFDFIQHDKQREELYKLSANRAEERFMNSKNSMGNLSSPKQHLYNQTSKDENRLSLSNSKHLKDEPVKPTMETTGPPPPPTNSYYAMPSRFLGPQPNVFSQGLAFDPNSPLFRHQPSFNNNFMNNLRFPNTMPGQMPIDIRSSLIGQDIGNKLNSDMNSHGNKKAIEILKQVTQQSSYKEQQDKVLMSPNSINKNSQNFSLGNSRQSSSQLNNVANLIHKEDNMSPQRHIHNHISHIGLNRDPFGALIQKSASGFATPYSQK